LGIISLKKRKKGGGSWWEKRRVWTIASLEVSKAIPRERSRM